MKNLFRILTILGGLTTFGLTISAAEPNLISFESHDISIELNVPQHRANISDNGLVSLTEGFNLFYLNENAAVDLFSIGGVVPDYFLFNGFDTTEIEKYIGGALPDDSPEGPHRLLAFKVSEAGQETFEIQFSAEFNQDVSQMRFSRETVGAEVSGTIIEKGAYLSPAAYYYPTGRDEDSYFRLTVNLPSEWEAISDGNRLTSETIGDRKIQTFANPYLSSGNMFMAGPYVVGLDSVDQIEVACYFFEEDSSLIADYLESTTGYIRMYSEMIGPYPFTRFTVVENFFPTGYGMPAWTLLGQQVIRLPFIRATSLGHEVLHNWWGNSVYVDYDRGNWCESITVYGADYHYKLLQSEEAAKTYRKNILKEYVSYVNDGNDFPIREFKGRTSANTRTIGYNKAMMVWHMIEQQIGSEPFWAAWETINERYLAKQIGWEEWIAVLEETSGADLSHIIPQWIDRAGAPEIALDFIGLEANTSGGKSPFDSWIKLDLRQNSPQLYRLHIPVRYTDATGVHDTLFVLANAVQRFRLPATECELVEIDPDHHIFRKLFPDEVEPIVSGVLGSEEQLFICNSDNEELRSAYQEFSNNLAGDSVVIQGAESISEAGEAIAPIVINPASLPEYYGEMLEIGSDSIRILDQWYPRAGHTFVLAGGKWSNSDKCMVILSNDAESLPRVGQLTPHYGKYSYLVFEGARNVGKGQWPVTNSPLVMKF